VKHSGHGLRRGCWKCYKVIQEIRKTIRSLRSLGLAANLRCWAGAYPHGENPVHVLVSPKCVEDIFVECVQCGEIVKCRQLPGWFHFNRQEEEGDCSRLSFYCFFHFSVVLFVVDLFLCAVFVLTLFGTTKVWNVF